MKRREFITLLGGAATAWPLAARAQQGDRIRRVGMLLAFTENDPDMRARISAFRQRFTDLGWTDSRNVRIDYRFSGSDIERLRANAKELLALAPDIMFAHSNPGLAALRQENRTVPTVFVQVADPVGSGFIQSLARPGGVTTGFTNFEPAMGSKWVEILKEIAPGVTRAAVLMHDETAANVAMFRAAEAAGPAFGMTVTVAGVRDAAGNRAGHWRLRPRAERRADRPAARRHHRPS
jgi:putative tryptophan/tyrosine transport system substrate-binding protein